MDSLHRDIFGGKVRVRACAVIIKDDQILLLKHEGIGKGGFLWAPPGGGMEFGESLVETLRREAKEEIGATVEIVKFLFFNEHFDNIFHAVEFFFETKITNGPILLGKDPELATDNQILKEVKWFTINDLKIIDQVNLHKALQNLNSVHDMLKIRGFFNFGKYFNK